MSLGKGCPINLSTKQKINTRSSTELVRINDALALMLWVRLFMIEQGFTVTDNVLHQDNQSTMLLAKNGGQSSGKKTRHIEIRYYFIMDQIHSSNVSLKYCPTEYMIADFFTKPLQGILFRKLRKLIMNLPDNIDSSPQECVENVRESKVVSNHEGCIRDTNPLHTNVPNHKSMLNTSTLRESYADAFLTCWSKPAIVTF